MKEYKLIIDLPFLAKGNHYQFNLEEGLIYRVVDGEPFEYPLRQGLSGYLWLLLTERELYLEEV